ncbi:MAG: hypothetical protein Crog4KO_18850 [Crocinitomicaceae bacterium]
MNTGATIQKLRKGKKVNQDEFAKRIGISTAALSHIETNLSNPKTSTLQKICEELNISVELLHLLSLDESSIPEQNRESYGNMFPQVHDLMIKIFSESPDKILKD